MFTGNAQPEIVHEYGVAIAKQLANSGLDTFLLADAKQCEFIRPEHGLSDILDRKVHPGDALVPMTEHLGFLDYGDQHRLNEQLPSGHTEQCIKELSDNSRCLVIIAPSIEAQLSI